MIQEDYCDFETAKLLKEKGFNEKLLTFYITDEAKKEGCFQLMAFTDDKIDNNHSDYCYLAPTLQMAMKWLREVHNIMVSPYALSIGYYFEIFDLTNRDITGCKPLYKVGIPYKKDVLSTYEQACEAAIKYTLENLLTPPINK